MQKLKISSYLTLSFSDKKLAAAFDSANFKSKNAKTLALLSVICILLAFSFTAVHQDTNLFQILSMCFVVTLCFAALARSFNRTKRYFSPKLLVLLSDVSLGLSLLSSIVELEESKHVLVFLTSFRLLLYAFFPCSNVSLVSESVIITISSYFTVSSLSKLNSIILLSLSFLKVFAAYSFSLQAKQAFLLDQATFSSIQNLLAVQNADLIKIDCSESKKMLLDSFYLNCIGTAIPGVTLLESIDALLFSSKNRLSLTMTNVNETAGQMKTDCLRDKLDKLFEDPKAVSQNVIIRENQCEIALSPIVSTNEIFISVKKQLTEPSPSTIPAVPTVATSSSSLNMVTGIAHDIKNSLICVESTISGLFASIHSSKEQDLKRALDLIDYSQILLNEIKDKNLLENNILKANELSDINLENLLEFVVSIFKAKNSLKAKKVNIFHQINSAEETFRSDEVRLKQILINLFSNSYKFTDSGFIQATVTAKEGKLFFEIEDSGCGMTQTELIQLNEAFKKDTSEKNSSGWGIGMMIVRELLSLLKATEFQVRSEVGKGTTVSFYLPFLRSAMKKASRTVSEKKLLLTDNSQVSKGSKLVSAIKRVRTNISSNKKVFLVETKNFRNDTIGQKTEIDRNGFYMGDSKEYSSSTSMVNLCSFEQELKMALNEFYLISIDKSKEVVFIVDDMESVGVSAKGKLARHLGDLHNQVEIVVSHDGVDCLFKMMACDFRVAVVLSDLNMNFMNGDLLEEAVTRICERKKNTVEFIYFSGDDINDKDSLSKPLDDSGADFIVDLVRKRIEDK